MKLALKRVNEVLNNDLFKYYIKRLKKLEQNRKFCLHNIEHSLDVARISYIYVLENHLEYSKEVVYTVALLHDLGRVLQYEEGTEHHEGSIIIAEKILKDIKFSEDEKEDILKAIKNHRKESYDKLSNIIYKSDKLSRNCFMCKAEEECYWSKDKKNFNINI